ncbi:MAG TPA: serine/threonine-protein kinase, partial [Acidobacteriota bacterium]|nr:serine/threonine-protein kinase [Acidobacteriota bacterium]
MAKPNFNLVKHFFSEVMDLPPAEHESWLLEHCPDSEVRKEVLSLLKYHGKPAAVDRPALRLQTAGLPERIDKYRVLSRLGEGGMGSVFLAERDDGLFNQKVALKVIRNKHVAGSLLKRFQLERQILASLNHPNISRLLDGGVTGQGQQFLVLEYVKGLHINDYCDRNRLTIHERLQLFKILCQTLHYAHHKFSLIHRDLKPGNILVDQDGVPKLLDFGIAKVLRREEIAWSQSLVLTPFGERQLTPLFASPEQIQGFELTIQSDIYSLGVILYELLCGRNPHRLHQVPIHRVAQVFCQEIPEA